MNKEELRAYLATNLKVELDCRKITYDTKRVEITVKLEDQDISKDCIYL